MQTAPQVLGMLDLIAIVIGSVGTIVTVLGFFASLILYFKAQKLQDQANNALITIQEKSQSIESRVNGMFDKTLDAAIGAQNSSKIVEQHQEVAINDSSVAELMDVIASPVHLKREEVIRTDLQKRGLSTEGDTVKILIRHLSAVQINLAFEQAYQILFGSQIALLRKLNQLRGQGLSQENLNAHFKAVVEKYPDVFATWTLAQYMNYLVSNNGVVIKNASYFITDLGVAFLAWLTWAGKREDKVL